jgi:hypothetical protein
MKEENNTRVGKCQICLAENVILYSSSGVEECLECINHSSDSEEEFQETNYYSDY